MYAAGTALYTNNAQVPMHIDYYDALSHPWFAGGDGAAVYVCARRDRACTNADPHNYEPNCSHANLSRFSAPGNAKVNSFDCTFNFSSEGDGPVYLCASAADQSIPDPDPNANEATAIFPTHVNQFTNPATGQGWTAADANLADSSCGSVILDRAPPRSACRRATRPPPRATWSPSAPRGRDGLSGISGPYDLGLRRQHAGQTGRQHHPHLRGPRHLPRACSPATTGPAMRAPRRVDIVVSKGQGGTGDEGSVVKPPSNDEIGGKFGIQKASLGSLKVIAPKKQKLGKKPAPILLTLIAAGPGAFQAALTKGPKIVSKGAAVLASAGTFGFKLQLPKRLAPGKYKLRLTFVPDGSASGSTKTIAIKFFRPPVRKRRGPARPAARAAADGAVNVDAGPPLAANHGG